MRQVRGIVWAALVLALSVTVAHADDLGFIRIINENQVSQAETIVGHAFAKLDDRFVISASAEQKDALAAAGITFELMVADTDPADFSLVLPRRKVEDMSRALRIGSVIASSGDVTLVQGGRSGDMDPDYFIIPLTERQIYFHYIAPVAAAAPAEVYPTDTLITKVRKDSIYAWNRHLELYQTRYVWTDQIDQARDWLASKFQQFGYTNVTKPTFSWNGGTHYNVKAVKTGYAEPEKVIVIGGHYDTWNQNSDPMVFAPGSDDDGSGTVVTLEVARILSTMPLRKTVIFMPFSAEEVGLVGSAAAAANFKSTHTNVEVMFNYDMVGFVTDPVWKLNLSSGQNTAYRELTAQNATRLTQLVPNIVAMGSSSDHYSFHSQGYPVVDNIETNFNQLGWHTDLDLTSRMNFDYLTEVVKLAVASVAIVANAASPTAISRIEDLGNGTQLEVFWDDCNPQYSYTLYYGRSISAMDSIQIPAGQCSQVISGLTDGVPCSFAVYGKPADGYRAINAPISSEMPLLYPRQPQLLTADPGDHIITLIWPRSKERDIASYRVYRRLSGQGPFDLWMSDLVDTTYTDHQVVSNVKYDYAVTAVDQTGYESPLSMVASSYPATFDGGILLVDEWTQDYSYFPNQAQQEAYWNTIFSSWPKLIESVEVIPQYLTKGTAGRFSSVFWMDDDIFNKIIKNSNSTLDWYTSFNTNVMVSGYRTVRNWITSPVPSNHVLYDEFMVSSYAYSNQVEFIGAIGDNGWPTLEVDPWTSFNTYEMPVLTPRPGATVIYRFDARNNNVGYEGQPCGVAYSGPHGKRIVLSFPLYMFTPASVTALITKAKEYFGETVIITTPGDLDGSGFVDLTDLSMMVAYLMGDFVPPDLDAADIDASCFVDLSDLSTIVSYLSSGVPTLLPGCIPD